MPCEFSNGAWETESHSRVHGGCHVSILFGSGRDSVSKLCMGKKGMLSDWQCMSVVGSLHVCWLLCWAGDGTAGDVLGMSIGRRAVRTGSSLVHHWS